MLAMRFFWRRKKSVVIVYLVLRLIVLASLVLSIVNGDYDSAFICVLVLVLFMVPAFIQDKLQMDFPSLLEIIILLFIFAAEILGELQNYYVHFAYWDTLLHTTWGFLCAAVGFSLVDLLNRSSRVRLQLSPFYLALGAFCFSMTVGVLWEFFEFTMDRLFLWDMQKDTIVHTISSVTLDPTMSNIPIVIDNITDVTVNGVSLGIDGYLDIGLYDTMEDLFVNFIGALVFSIIGYLDVKSHGRSRIAASLIPRMRREAPAAESSGGAKAPEARNGAD
jgi:hypothetical protein